MLYSNIKILSCEKNSFEGDKGQTVEYYVNVVKTDDGDIITVNSGKDYGGSESETGMGVFRITQEDKRFKLTLADFHKGTSIEKPEEEIS